MTLPCDASRDIHPENRAGKYTTVLAREVVLEGDYEVGLSECVIPIPKNCLNFKQSMYILERVAVFESHLPSESTRTIERRSADQPMSYDTEFKLLQEIEIDATKITSISDFAVLESPKTSSGKDAFMLSVKDRRLRLSVAPNIRIAFDKKNAELARLLGFSLRSYEGSRNSDAPYMDFEAPAPFGGPGALFFVYIYCDLVEYSFVGDSMVPCLRTLPAAPDETKPTILRFENPHYVPVAQSRFSQVTIEIANDQGEEILFNKGLSLIKLHFRPKKR